MSRPGKQVCGLVDNASALPTTPQTQHHQQKSRTYDSLLRVDICTRYRHLSQHSGPISREHVNDSPMDHSVGMASSQATIFR